MPYQPSETDEFVGKISEIRARALKFGAFACVLDNDRIKKNIRDFIRQLDSIDSEL